jgi:hypothetical protein
MTVANKYTYVMNQPTIYADPKGEWAFFVAFAIGFAVQGGMAANQGASLDGIIAAGLVGGVSQMVAPGLGNLLAGSIGSVAATVIGNIAAGAVGGFLQAAVFGGNAGQGALLGAAGGAIGILGYYGLAYSAFGWGLTQAASHYLASPWGVIGGASVNTGDGPGPQYQIRLLPQE